ncbi:MAG: alpha/beta hydrolase [Butyrivibrio sp.]|nr:alpha/beta hydrolase [Butyrivibrio sp.]
MIYEKISLKEKGSQDYPNLTLYIQEYSDDIAIEKRPLIIICPGGGYEYTSDREAEPIALSFMAKGFHAAVLRYSVAPSIYPTALLELGRSIAIIRSKATEYHIDKDKIAVFGASAGGHLAADFACEWKDGFIEKELGVSEEDIRPNGLLLAYPVITSGKFAHRGSFVNLLGDHYDELVEKVSLEKRVNENVPPVFMWHTFTDGSVPVENSLLFASALREKNINTELHIFPVGGHGLALANKLTLSHHKKEDFEQVVVWIDLATTWLNNL